MWRKIPLGFKFLLVINLISLYSNLSDFHRYAWVTYFLSYPTYPPISFGVILFDLVLAVGAMVAILTRKLWFWKIGVVYYGYNALVSLVVLGKLFIGPRSGQLGAFEFQFNLLVYGLSLVFSAFLLHYFYSRRSYFNKQ